MRHRMTFTRLTRLGEHPDFHITFTIYLKNHNQLVSENRKKLKIITLYPFPIQLLWSESCTCHSNLSPRIAVTMYLRRTHEN